MKTKLKSKRLLSMIPCCVMLLGIMPVTAFADGVTEATGTIVIPFQKTWDDNENANGFRPESISISLYKYAGDAFSIDSATLIETKNISADDSWHCDFDISNEEILDSNGNTYRFKIVESEVDKYHESEHTDPNVIFTPPSAGRGWERIEPCSELQIESQGSNKSVVIAKKGSNYTNWTVDALSPTEREIIFASAKEKIDGFGQGDIDKATFISGIGGTAYGMTVTLDTITFDNPSDWSFFAIGLYQKSSTEANGSTITNKYTPETTVVSGSKTWDDADNQDGKRPESITINLLKNGEKIDSKTVTANDQWSWTFDNLAKYENGKEINYSITEEAVTGYSTSYDGYNVTNSYTPGKVSVSVSKSWQDNDNQDGIRPNDITVQLMADGKVVQGKTLTLSNGNQWTGSFTELPEYQNGQKIAYTVEEVKVEGYSSVISGNIKTGFVITNSHTPKAPSEPSKPDEPTKPAETNPNTGVEVPKTGDNRNMALWIALLFVSGIGLFGTTVYSKKKKSMR